MPSTEPKEKKTIGNVTIEAVENGFYLTIKDDVDNGSRLVFKEEMESLYECLRLILMPSTEPKENPAIFKLRKICLSFDKVDWYSEQWALVFRDLENLLLDSIKTSREEALDGLVDSIREYRGRYPDATIDDVMGIIAATRNPLDLKSLRSNPVS